MADESMNSPTRLPADHQPIKIHPLLTLEQVPPNFAKIANEVEAGYVSSQAHPHLPLRILNYTQQAQFEWRWNAETIACRGLIIDAEDQIIARPFPKFFSYEQLAGLVPNEPFEAFEKLDGSLGILYQHDGHVEIASRGSFTSMQARRATEIYQQKYKHVPLDPGLTYLFEIIYPENRIVVDYGPLQDLILIAVIDTESGVELPLPDIGFPCVKRYDGILQFHELLETQDDTREGFVVRYQSGTRIKIKFDEYKRLHKILTGVNPKLIWENLVAGKELSSIIDSVPDEFYDWVRQVENDLRSKFQELERQHVMHFKSTPAFSSRREYADHFKTLPNPAIMFAMLDGKPYAEKIWKMLRPKTEPLPHGRADLDS